MDSAIIAAAIGPIMTGIVAGLGVWLQDSRKQRNRQQAYREAVQQATEQVAFIEGWLNAHERVASSDAHEQARQRVLLDLENAYVVVNRNLEAVRQHKPLTVRMVFARLLLVDSAPRGAGRVLAILYYLALAWLLVWVSFGMALGLTAVSSRGTSVLEAAGFGFGIFILSVALRVAPTLPLYLLARSAVSRDRAARRHLATAQEAAPLHDEG